MSAWRLLLGITSICGWRTFLPFVGLHDGLDLAAVNYNLQPPMPVAVLVVLQCWLHMPHVEFA